MLEDFGAVDGDDGDVPPVAACERGVEVNVDIFHLVLVPAPCGENLAACLLAEVAAGPGVELHARFLLYQPSGTSFATVCLPPNSF